MRFFPKAKQAIESTFDDLFKSLVELENKFVVAHAKNPLAAPNDYDLDVKAYCVLAHAAFEEYIEQVGIIVAKAIVENYKYRQVVNDALLMLVHSQASYISLYKEGPPESIDTVFDYLRNKLEELVENFEKSIDRSHGFGYKYVDKVLVPLAIDLTKDSTLLASYKSLTKERGAYAHKRNQYGVFYRSIAPEKAQDIVGDCLLICDDIRKKALLKM
ncbi:HEPN domain-containing protein [Hymenobacter sp. CRA2]|uniref:HEPN domain-containing protein n=1 Tax=Hymenobacter sp. CRA2 TaxID=1955620 RepID=UPI0011163190|nr:HEPN domain-containing protein [Hymenobacter sp. CRA2]